MWQEIAIVIIGMLTLAYAGRKIYRLFVPSKKKHASCCNCTQDCPMKEPDNRNTAGK
jgi:hypothetical protein